MPYTYGLYLPTAVLNQIHIFKCVLSVIKSASYQLGLASALDWKDKYIEYRSDYLNLYGDCES